MTIQISVFLATLATIATYLIFSIACDIKRRVRWRLRAKRAISARREKLAELLVNNKMIWRQK